MWEHYRKRFWGMQAVITSFAVGYYLISHRLLFPALLLFVTMQLGSLLGAAWASRLKRKYQGPWVVSDSTQTIGEVNACSR
jgi:uncharacterized membrane protein YfcA